MWRGTEPHERGAPSAGDETRGDSRATTTVDLTVRVHGAAAVESEAEVETQVEVEASGNGDPIPIPAAPDDLAAGDEAVLSWLAADPTHRARFVLDHAGALAAADPDLDAEVVDALARTNRRGSGVGSGAGPGVELRSVAVTVADDASGGD
jgi:hypothetical protein